MITVEERARVLFNFGHELGYTQDHYDWTGELHCSAWDHYLISMNELRHYLYDIGTWLLFPEHMRWQEYYCRGRESER